MPGREEFADEVDRLGVGPQVVRVGDAAGQDEAVELLGLDLADGARRLVGLALVEVVEGLDVAGLRGEQLGLRARRLDRLARRGQLDFLDALVGGQEGDLLALQLV